MQKPHKQEGCKNHRDSDVSPKIKWFIHVCSQTKGISCYTVSLQSSNIVRKHQTYWSHYHKGGWKDNINDSELQWKGNNRVKTVWLQLACPWLQGFLSLICYSSVGTAGHWCWAIGVWLAVGIPAHLQGVGWSEVKAEHRQVTLLHTEARKTFLYGPRTSHAAMSE